MEIKNYKYKYKEGSSSEELKSKIKCQCNLKLQKIFYKYTKIFHDLNNTYSFYNIDIDYFNRIKEIEKEIKTLEMPNDEIKLANVSSNSFSFEVYSNYYSRNLHLIASFFNPYESDLSNISLDFLKIFDFGQHILVDEKLCFDRLTPYNVSKLFISIAKKISFIFGQFAFFRINEFKYLEKYYYGDYDTKECSIYISIFLYLVQKEYYMSFEFRGRIFYLIYFCEVEDAKELNLIGNYDYDY